MEYSIQELSHLSGVTTRTLRWYDQIGLLKPSRVAESGYRYYSRAEVDRLQAAVQAGLSPKGEEGKEITALHRQWLTITGNRYDPARHRGIAELYVMDARFTAYYDKQVPGCARFLRDAVVYWVK